VSGGIAQLFLNLRTRRVCGQHHASAAFTPGKDSVPIVQEVGGPGAVLDGCGKSCPTRIRSPDLPAHSESLYRLRYPGSIRTVGMFFKIRIGLKL
jgi:hypothetical protein